MNNNNIIIKNYLKEDVYIIDSNYNVVRKYYSDYKEIKKINENKIFINDIKINQFNGYDNVFDEIKKGVYYIVEKEVAIYFKRKDLLYIDDYDIYDIYDNKISTFALTRIK